MKARIKAWFSKRKITAITAAAAIIFTIAVAALPAAADTMEGTGTATDPYIITTADRLASITSIGLGKCYQLGNDIDLSNYGDWTPIGNASYNFTGIFDGNGHKITGLTIGTAKVPSTASNLGLFGCISGATIKNLGVGAVIYSSGGTIGGLVGSSVGSTISSCYSSSNLIGVQYIGGIVGYNYSSTITDSYANTSVNGTGNQIGGFEGENNSCKIENCYAVGNVTGAGTNTGGFAGRSIGTTTLNCYATGNVTGNSNVGGFFGITIGYIDTSPVYNNVSNSYSIGNITGNSVVGGFVGFQSDSYCSIQKCYWCYSNNSTAKIGVNTDKGTTDLAGLASSDMQVKSFADTLNNNISTLSLSKCAAWKYIEGKNNGYPVLDGIGDGDTSDVTAPTGTYTLSPSTSTTGPVTINFSASDDSSGVKSIKLPDGSVVTAAAATYTVSKNGTYDFVVTDNAGNTATIPAVVSNIGSSSGTGAASITLTSALSAGNSSAVITIAVTGSSTATAIKWASGAQTAAYFASNGTAVVGTSFTVSLNGTYTVYAHFADGTETVQTIDISGIGAPSPTTADENIAEIVNGKNCKYAITVDGDVYAWGYNNYGQLGIGTTKNTSTPTKISGLSGVSDIIVNDNNSVYAITDDGSVYAWGYNNHGQLGVGDTKHRTSPAKISGLSDVEKIVANSDSAYAYTSDGDIYAWGNNSYGQLGVSGGKNITRPKKVTGLIGG